MSKTKMKIAAVMSESPALARKDFDLGLALCDRGHEVTFIQRIGDSSSSGDVYKIGNRSIKTIFIEAESSVHYSYQVHLELTERNFSVAVGHSYKAPLYFEALHGGVPLVVIHEDSFLFDPLKEDEVANRNALWTQHLLQLHTLKVAEKVISYSSQSASNLSRSGIQIELLEEPVEIDFGKMDLDKREALAIVCDSLKTTEMLQFLLNAIEIKYDEICWVRPEEVYQNRDAFQKSFAALVLCEVPSLDILKYGCIVVRPASKTENVEGAVYVSPDEDKEAYKKVLKSLYSLRSEEFKKLKEILKRRSYSNILERGLEKVLLDSIPAAIVRGRTRGW